jgi:hypothetical protein
VIIDDGISLLRLKGVDAGLLDGWRENQRGGGGTQILVTISFFLKTMRARGI